MEYVNVVVVVVFFCDDGCFCYLSSLVGKDVEFNFIFGFCFMENIEVM